VIAEVAQNAVRARISSASKTQLIAEAIYAQDNQASLGRWYGAALTTGLSVDDVRAGRIASAPSPPTRCAPPRKNAGEERSVTRYLIKDTTPKPRRSGS